MNSEERQLSTRADLPFYLLFVLFTSVELCVLRWTPLDLSGDEAHYWEWSRRLDYCYYSKGPLVAWLIAASTSVLGDTAFAVRLPAAICFALFSLVFYFFARSLYGSRWALAGWLTLRVTLAFVQSGLLMTTDAPMLLCWLLGLVAAHRALIKRSNLSWLWFGIAVGIGLWSKYTLIFLPAGVLLFVLLEKPHRHQLRNMYFYFGMLIAASFLLPIVYWNQKHRWVNLQHNVSHAVEDKGLRLNPGYFFEMLLGQIGLVGPVVFGAIVWALYRGLKSSVGDNGTIRLFALTSAPLAGFILVVSLTKRIYVNWPSPIFIGGLLALLALVGVRESLAERWKRLVYIGLGINILCTVLGHALFLGKTFGLSGEILPTKKLAGWSELGSAVAALQRGVDDNFILTDRYGAASAISFYAEDRPFVYLADLSERRMTQYDIWVGDAEWRALRGKDSLIVLSHPEYIEPLRSRFARLEPLEQATVAVTYGGEVLRRYHFYRGYDFTGEPAASTARRF